MTTETTEAAEGRRRVDVHETMRELAANSGVLRRISPRKSWPEVVEADEKVADLDRRRERIAADLQELRERQRTLEREDRERMAVWVDACDGDRPLPEAPTLNDTIRDREEEIAALALAVDRQLAHKQRLVERSRGRLVADAAKHVEEGIARMLRLLDQLEATRDEVLEYDAARRWAETFPAEGQAENPDGRYLMCGRRTAALPELRFRVDAWRVIDALREDAAPAAGEIEANRDQRRRARGLGGNRRGPRRDRRKEPATGRNEPRRVLDEDGMGGMSANPSF